MDSIQEFIISTITFINNVLLPLLFALALLFFVWNAFRFFILGSHEQDGRDKAKQLAIYGIAGFVILVSIWGIVNLLIGGLGLGANSPVKPDYLEQNSYEDYGSGTNYEGYYYNEGYGSGTNQDYGSGTNYEGYYYSEDY